MRFLVEFVIGTVSYLVGHARAIQRIDSDIADRRFIAPSVKRKREQVNHRQRQQYHKGPNKRFVAHFRYGIYNVVLRAANIVLST